MFLALLRHGKRSVSQLVVLALLWLHSDGVRSRPVVAIDDRSQYPQLIGPIVNHKVARVTRAYVRSEV